MSNQKISTDRGPKPAGPYSQAIVAGNTIYVAGQGPLDPRTGQLVNASFEAEAVQTLENIAAILQAANFALKDVVKVTVYLSDLGNFAQLNEIYRRYFQEPYPARATVGATLLFDTRIEVDCIAVKE